MECLYPPLVRIIFEYCDAWDWSKLIQIYGDCAKIADDQKLWKREQDRMILMVEAHARRRDVELFGFTQNLPGVRGAIALVYAQFNLYYSNKRTDVLQMLEQIQWRGVRWNQCSRCGCLSLLLPDESSIWCSACLYDQK